MQVNKKMARDRRLLEARSWLNRQAAHPFRNITFSLITFFLGFFMTLMSFNTMYFTRTLSIKMIAIFIPSVILTAVSIYFLITSISQLEETPSAFPKQH